MSAEQWKYEVRFLLGVWMFIYLYVVVGSSVGWILWWAVKSALPSVQILRQFWKNPESELVIISRRKKCADLKYVTISHSFITCPFLFSLAYMFLHLYFFFVLLRPTFLSFPFVDEDCLDYGRTLILNASQGKQQGSGCRLLYYCLHNSELHTCVIGSRWVRAEEVYLSHRRQVYLFYVIHSVHVLTIN